VKREVDSRNTDGLKDSCTWTDDIYFPKFFLGDLEDGLQLSLIGDLCLLEYCTGR
jgi:hypothetical protein